MKFFSKIIPTNKQKQIEELEQNARHYFGVQQFESAQAAFSELIKLGVHSASVYFGIAWSTLSSGKANSNEEAARICIPLFEQALNSHRQSPDLNQTQLTMCYSALGFLKKASDQREESMSYYQAALNSAPPNSFLAADARHYLSIYYYEDGRLDEAIRLLEEAVHIMPDHPYAAGNLQQMRHEREKFNIQFQLWMGISQYHVIVRVHPDDTLLQIAERAVSGMGINPANGFFLMSGDNVQPEYLDSGVRDPYQTLRELGLHERDKISLIQVGYTAERKAFRLISRFKEKQKASDSEDTEEVIRWTIKDMEEYYQRGRLDEARLLVEMLQRIEPENMAIRNWQQTIETAVKERDAGSYSTDGTSWCQIYGGAARTNQASSAPLPPFAPLWQLTVDNMLLNPPVVADKSIFITSLNHTLNAVNSDTGEIRWQWKAATPIEESPIVFNGSVFVTNRDSICCLDSSTGKMRWQQQISRFRSVSLQNHELIGVTTDGTVWKLATETGEFTLSFPTGIRGLRALASNENHIVALSDNVILGFDPQIKSIRWKREGRFDYAFPVIAYENVYCGTFAEGLWCLDANNGRMRWVFGTYSWIRATPAVGQGHIYFGDMGGRFGCLDAFTGQLIWSPVTWAANHMSCRTAPVIGQSIVYIALDNGIIYCFDRISGTELWRTQAEEWGGNINSLSVVSDAIYYSTEHGKLACMAGRKLTERLNLSMQLPRAASAIVNLRPPSTAEKDADQRKLTSKQMPDWMRRQDVDDFNISSYYLIEDRFEEALGVLQRLDKAHPDQPMILYNLALSYAGLGMTGDALIALDRLLEIEPGNAHGFFKLQGILRENHEICSAIYGQAESIYEPPNLPNLADLAEGIKIILFDSRPGLICGISNDLVELLASASVWYWWQLIETRTYPVLRLYIEFIYQPYRYHEILLPLDFNKPDEKAWLDQMQHHDSFLILIYDGKTNYRFTRFLSATEEQRTRLHKLIVRADQTLSIIPVSERNFDSAIQEAIGMFK